MTQTIREDIWKMISGVYGFAGAVPDSDNQIKLVDVLTNYVLATSKGIVPTTISNVTAANVFADNYGKVVRKRGRPKGAKNKI